MDTDYVFEVTKGSIGALTEFAVAIEVLDIEEFNLNNEVYIYPNPNNGVLNVKLNVVISNEANFKLYVILGKLIYQQTLSNQETQIKLNDLCDGVYLSVIEITIKEFLKKL